MKIRGYFLACLLGAWLAACEGEDKFTIEGEVINAPTMNLYMKYYGNDALRSSVTAVKDGKFEFSGVAKQPAIADILDNEYHVMGRVYVANNDRVTVKLDRHNPYKMEASGTRVNEDWSAAVRANADSLFAGSAASINAIIERYIASHPASIVSSLLFVTSYDASLDPLRADSVVQSIEADARPGSLFDSYATIAAHYVEPESHQPIDTLRFRPLAMDTSYVFTPGGRRSTLLVFSDDKCFRSDSIVPRLKRLHRQKDVEIIDLAFIGDTMSWRRMVRGDSATWVQGWAPGAQFARGIDRLAIPVLPYYIALDSAGNQTYRGRSLDQAISAATKRLK